MGNDYWPWYIQVAVSLLGLWLAVTGLRGLHKGR
jgi:hypothetical protein